MSTPDLNLFAERLLHAIPGAASSTRAVVSLLRACTPRLLNDGEVLCREGQPGDSVFFLSSGKLRVESTLSESSRALFLQSAPAMLGQMSLVDGSPRSATLVAVGAVEVLVLAQADWTRLYGAPTVAGGALRRLVLASLTDQLARASYLMNDLLPPGRDDNEVDMRSIGRIAGVIQGWELDDQGLDSVRVSR